MRTIFSRVRLSGKSVAALLALMLLSAVTSMLLPTALASMIDVGVAGQSRSAIVVVAAVMAALSILGCVFNVAATVLSAKVSTRFAADLRHEIFHQVQSFSAAEMERFGTASLVTRSTSDVTNVQMFLSLLLRLGVTAPLMAVAGLVLSSLTGGELSSVLNLAIPALILGAGVIILLVSRYSVTLRRQIDRLNKLFLETLEGVRVIRAFNRQDREMERFAQANGELTATTILSGRVSALLMPVIQIIFGVTTAAVMGMGAWYVSAGEMDVGALVAILESVLYEFPVRELDFAMPRWITMLDSGHWLQSSVYQAALDFAARITRMKDLQAAGAQALDCEAVARSPVTGMDLAEGSVRVTVELKPEVFYQVLSEQTGLEIGDEAGLMPCIIELARAKREYERLQGALEQVEATGYGIVMPSVDQMHLEQPQIVRQGGRYGVRLEASAPSIHIIWNKQKFRTEKSTERKSIQSGVDGIHLNISTTKAAAPFGELPLLLWVGVYINQDEHMVS